MLNRSQLRQLHRAGRSVGRLAARRAVTEPTYPDRARRATLLAAFRRSLAAGAGGAARMSSPLAPKLGDVSTEQFTRHAGMAAYAGMLRGLRNRDMRANLTAATSVLARGMETREGPAVIPRRAISVGAMSAKQLAQAGMVRGAALQNVSESGGMNVAGIVRGMLLPGKKGQEMKRTHRRFVLDTYKFMTRR